MIGRIRGVDFSTTMARGLLVVANINVFVFIRNRIFIILIIVFSNILV